MELSEETLLSLSRDNQLSFSLWQGQELVGLADVDLPDDKPEPHPGTLLYDTK